VEDDSLAATAFELYWEVAAEGTGIPVAFAFDTVDGSSGLAAQGVPVDSARELVYSSDYHDRAAAAVLATAFAMEKFVESDDRVRLRGS
jgi:hypothetical protein